MATKYVFLPFTVIILYACFHDINLITDSFCEVIQIHQHTLICTFIDGTIE